LDRRNEIDYVYSVYFSDNVRRQVIDIDMDTEQICVDRSVKIKNEDEITRPIAKII